MVSFITHKALYSDGIGEGSCTSLVPDDGGGRGKVGGLYDPIYRGFLELDLLEATDTCGGEQ